MFGENIIVSLNKGVKIMQKNDKNKDNQDIQNNLNENFRTEFSETMEFSPQKQKKNKKKQK